MCMGRISSLSIVHPIHPHKKKSPGFSSRRRQTATNPRAGPPVLKCQYQPTCAQGKPQMKGVTPPGMSVPCYDKNFETMTAHSAPQGQEMAGNLKSTQGYHRLCFGPDSEPSHSVIALISSLRTKLEQYTSDSHPLNSMYEVGSILPLYSKGIPCRSIPGDFYFHIPKIYFFNLIS